MQATFPPGYIIDGRYRVTRMLGQGAHGVVYAAKDEMLDAPVAVKSLAPHLAAQDNFKVRMFREARAMGKLSGTSATQIFSFNKSPDGGLYIVMELLDGSDFEKYLARDELRGARMQLDRLIDLLAPIASTLDVAHRHGIIHRDVKPSNIFVLQSTVRGGVRLLDFGLAKDLNVPGLTAKGVIAGSPGFIAPEYLLAQTIDHRIDVYALGCVVFRALAGVLPFNPKMPLMNFLEAQQNGNVPRLRAFRSELPAGIDGWVSRSLAFRRAERFQSVGEMWQELRSVARLAPAPPIEVDVEMPWDVEIDADIEVEVESIRSKSPDPVG